jgi:hypothetical protein
MHVTYIYAYICIYIFHISQSDDDPSALGEGEAAGAPSTRIWGTNVSVETCMHVFRNFLRNFNPPSSGAPGPLSHYMRQLHVLHRTQGAAFNLNCSHLYDHIASRSLYRQLQVNYRRICVDECMDRPRMIYICIYTLTTTAFRRIPTM